jgi:hypothetical protein
MKSALTILMAAAFFIVLFLIGPLAVIWSWNTLFGAVHSVPYSIDTWFAVLIIGMFVRGEIHLTKKQ